MTTYYSFDAKYPTRYEPMNPANRMPPNGLAISLGERMNQALEAATQDGPEVQSQIIPCCTKPKPCPTWISWKPQYAGCGQNFMTWDQATNGKCQGCEIGRDQDPRIWTADLNPLIDARSVISGAKWAPEPYSHPHARQLHTQFLYSTLYPQKSPNEKQIDRIEDSYCVLKKRYGENLIQYTTF